MEQKDRIAPDMAASLFAWWRDAGVDALVGEEPRNLLAAPAPVRASEAAPALSADRPETLDGFLAWLTETRDLAGAAPGAPRIAPAGDPASGLMILADMPTPEDFAEVRLVSGAAGRLFDSMLAAIGRDRAHVWLAPLSPLRPPGGRLAGAEIEALAALARHHIALVKPKALFLLGDVATKALLGLPLNSVRGRVHLLEPSGVKCVASFKPEFLLAHPQQKRRAWDDLRLLMKALA